MNYRSDGLTVKHIFEYTVFTRLEQNGDMSITSEETILEFKDLNSFEIYHHGEDRLLNMYYKSSDGYEQFAEPLSIPKDKGYMKMKTYREPRDG